MDIKLFTSVTDSLPEINTYCPIIAHYDGNDYFGIGRYQKFGQTMKYWNIISLDKTIYFLNTQDAKVTHWLDSSRLTTKEIAEDLVERAWIGGHKYCEARSNGSLSEFKRQNMHELWN